MPNNATATNYALVAPKGVYTASDFYSRHLQESRTAIIRTSDRAQFRGCRRRWAWSSHLMQNREPSQKVSPLWYGTGIHFALEDMFGHKQFEHPEDAFKAYVKATYRHDPEGMPPDWKEHLDLGVLTLRYFRLAWLRNRDPFKTLVIDGEPQVEVNFLVEVPFPLKKFGFDRYFDRVLYAGTIDRVIVDEYDRLWLVDYKTAKTMKLTHFEQSSQVSAYMWAAQKLYDMPVAGMWYWQFSKNKPAAPRQLVNGSISVAKNQITSRFLYKLALERNYGSVDKAPSNNVEFLNYLASLEGEDHDPYIRRDKVIKSQQALESEGQKILLELEDMLDPDKPIYPNPTFTCPGCPFYEPCISMDDGSDWEDQLMSDTRPRDAKWDVWRKHLVLPNNGSEPEFDEYEPWKEPEPEPDPEAVGEADQHSD